MKKNPYTLLFGKKPGQIISRLAQVMPIVDVFDDEDPSQQIYMITGVRGSGKTVFMTEVASRLEKLDEWISIELNPEKNLLDNLIAKLNAHESVSGIIRSAKLNLSFWGIGIDIKGTPQITDNETAIIRIMEGIKKHGKKLLITIDEVTNSQTMKEFAAAFQIFIRHDLPIYLLMTGLFENISRLENEKSLTFLYRAPKINIKPLDMSTMTANYQKNFKLERDIALEMARSTRGYSFAFQVLGYFTWEYDGDYRAAMGDYKQYLNDYVYEKIWSELSEEDKRVLKAMAAVPSGQIQAIREILNMDTNHFNPYRKRLIQKGIIDGSERGVIRFVLPYFEDYVSDN